MEIKERLRRALRHTQWFTDKLLEEIPEGPDWVLRAAPNTNHAIWIAGHLALATNAFIGFIDPARKELPEDFAALFGKGTQPLDDLDAYPPPAQVRAVLKERGGVFIELLEQSSEEDLSREVPQGPGFMYDVGAVFQMAAWHEALHAGQLTVIHRLVGQTPIADRK